jgi:Fe2+ or Zn2+ uptake regulation protein
MERLTKQRKLILEELKKLKTHPTAPELYIKLRKKLPNISLGTVYRNLEILSQEGKILKISCDNFNRFDSYINQHPHFFCKSCQKVFDIKQQINLQFNKNSFERKTGSKVLKANIILCGICKNCKGD